MAYAVNQGEIRDTLFNIALQQAINISNLLKRSTDNFLGGKMREYFWSLVAIRRSINYDLSDEERTEMDGREDKLSRLLRQKDKRVVAQEIKAYHLRLMDLLKNLGFFPNRDDRTKLNF